MTSEILNKTYMDKVAIVISMSYIGTNKHLPGSIIDMYIARKYFTSNNYKVFCITDFDRDYPNIELIIATSLARGTANEDIYNIWEQDNLYLKCDLIETVKYIMNSNSMNKIVLYFSGHTYKKQIYITDVDKINTLSLTELIKVPEQIWIFDSCYCDIMLKYKYNGKNLIKNRDCEVKEKITAIVSSESSERSYSTNIGSLFTRYFFSLQENYKIKNVEYISAYIASMIARKNKGYNQNVCFFSSYDMSICKLPEWL